MSSLVRHKAGRGIAALLRERRGFTLPEVIVVMGIFLVVIMITSTGFQTVLRQASQQTKQVETEIGNIVGLELFRSDLQNAGYGLPWALQAPPSAAFTEVAAGDATMAADWWPAGKSPASFNDTPASSSAGVPRAVQNLMTTFNKDSADIGSQYLVLKSLTAAPGETPKKWSTVTFGGAGKAETVWDPNGPRAFTAAEKVIVIRNTFDGDIPKRELEVTKATGAFYSTFGNYSTLTLPHSVGGDPSLVTDVFQVYGVDPGNSLRMPFNRADYYVSVPARMPASCAPNTGVLYKAVASQISGFTQIPLLDCVADMQVAYGLGPAGGGQINNHDSALRGTGPGGAATAKEIREQLKEIRVYILAHEGKKDMSYTYPSETIRVGENFGGGLIGRNFNLKNLIGGADWSHYRWKVYTIVVHPKNLIQ